MKPTRIVSTLFFALLLIACTTSNTEAQTVYITKTGKKYHRESCQYLRKSQYAISLKEASDRGYTACSVCAPGSIKTEKKPEQNSKPATNQKPKSTEKPKVDNEVKSRQCTATTKSGSRCKRMTTNASGRCYQH